MIGECATTEEAKEGSADKQESELWDKEEGDGENSEGELRHGEAITQRVN